MRDDPMDGSICDVLVIGGGPAGLRVAELTSAAGWRTVVADQKPSVGRKFLVAGRGGLNLTHSEPVKNFPQRYGNASGRWKELLSDFSPRDLRDWAESLGIESFIGTSGRVFPITKQAAPLLRRWIEHLRKQGVTFCTRHSMAAFRRIETGVIEVDFLPLSGPIRLRTRVLILALGGASWPTTGSDGAWVSLLAQAGIGVTPLTPANCGYEVAWPPEVLRQAEGLPLKNVVVSAAGHVVAGELLITKYGLEGGALYQLGRALRAMAQPAIEIDLKPSFTTGQLAVKAVSAWRLSPAANALLEMRGPFRSIEERTAMAKTLPIALQGPRPITEAISTAGGVSWDELDDHLMLKRIPGLFCAGEMIDWDAPTGGYLLQGCFSTATRAARGAIARLRKQRKE